MRRLLTCVDALFLFGWCFDVKLACLLDVTQLLFGVVFAKLMSHVVMMFQRCSG